MNGQTDRFVGSLYEILASGPTKAHIFFGSTRLASVERTPVITAAVTDFIPRKVRRAFAALEEFFVGKCYAATTLPSGTTLSFYHGDHLGSVNVVTDHTGAKKELAEYKPFGTFSRKETSGPPPATPEDSKRYFTGKRLDSSTGLYYYGARYYDPELGRFTQPDSIVQAPSDPQTLNRYTYCRNNPLIYTDPTGHSFWKKVGKILRQWVAPIAAVAVFFVSGGNVAFAAATYSYFATTGANLERGRGFFESVGRGALAAGATFAGAYIGEAIIGGGFGTAVGAGAAGGASTAGLSGGDPLLGAAAGAAAGAVGGLLGGIGGNLKGLAAYARIGAVGAASGAASGAIFGDAGGGAWRGAAFAISVAIAAKSFQAAIDIGQKAGGAEGRSAVAAEAATGQAGNGASTSGTPATTPKAQSHHVRYALQVKIGVLPTSPVYDQAMELGVKIGVYGDTASLAVLAVPGAIETPVGMALFGAAEIVGRIGNGLTFGSSILKVIDSTDIRYVPIEEK